MKANEILNLISKQWANVKDIMLLANCGRNKANKIKANVEKALENWYLPYGQIPMPKLVEYLNIDIKYLKRLKGE